MKQFVFIFSLLISVITHGQTVISGTIKDVKNKAIVSASLSVKDSYDGTTTDSTGSFRFSTSEKGQHVLLVSAIGYKTLEQQINLDGSSKNITAVLKEEINSFKLYRYSNYGQRKCRCNRCNKNFAGRPTGRRE